MAFQTPKAHPAVSKLGGKSAIPSSSLPSSSPAFGTPIHPLKPFDPEAISKNAILPIILPPATLRPLAFRVFTKKHSLTITSTALQELATFVGKQCGAGWKEEGLAEKVLEEAAKSWKNRNGGVIVNGDNTLKEILKTLEGTMRQGKIMTPAELSRQNSLDKQLGIRLGLRPPPMERSDSNSSVGLSRMAIDDEDEDDGSELLDPRKWLSVVNAFDQPRYTYNVSKKQFERETSKPSLLPSASHKTDMFRNRYQVIHQRLLRNEAFQQSAVTATRGPPSLSRGASDMTAAQTYKITPISNLLGRHGTHHMILGLLIISPTGTLAISDPTGTIDLDVSQALSVPEDSAWYAPGMIVLADGVYEEEDESQGKGLSGSTGVGGTLGGRFQGFFIGQPPCERRKATLGITGPEGAGSSHTIGGGFGWIDFLGVGSERAVGTKMRRLEQRILRRAAMNMKPPEAPSSALTAGDSQTQATQGQGETQASSTTTAGAQRRAALPGRNRVVIIGEVNLDNPRALQALRKVLQTYSGEPEGRVPVSFVLTGNFMSRPTMARTGGAGTGESAGGGGSIEYKECFDELAAILADFPSLVQSSTFVMVPGDNDGWASAFGGGAAVPLPRKPVPQIFTTRIRRTVATANAEADKECEGAERTKGEIVFATNPSRISMFGPLHEMVLFRDDMAARLRRGAVRLKTSGQKQDEQNGDGSVGDAAMSGAALEESQGIESMELEAPQGDGDGGSAKKNVAGDRISYDIREARKLVKTVLDQGYLSPFRPQVRPVYWDWASSLHLYPLPTAMVLVDTTIPPFAVTYEGCHVVNPGSLVVAGRRGVARWAEYSVGGTGRIRECMV